MFKSRVEKETRPKVESLTSSQATAVLEAYKKFDSIRAIRKEVYESFPEGSDFSQILKETIDSFKVAEEEVTEAIKTDSSLSTATKVVAATEVSKDVVDAIADASGGWTKYKATFEASVKKEVEVSD
jgi:hypothetical protein